MDAQVDLNPHQLEAALFAFRSPLSNGAILADEVGLGKTIEAGLVISQKWAERKRKILIIVPSNLRKQWLQELSDKFFLHSLILETKSFNDVIKKSNFNPFEQKDKIIICSYQFARKQEVYIKNINWDLIVIDEAHRLRNVYKPTNKIANSIKESTSHSPKILLTATPLQNSLLELYGLVSIIDDFTFGDLSSFKNQFLRIDNEQIFVELKSRLKPICIRTLRRQVLEYVKYTNRIAITQEFFSTNDEQRLYDLVSDYLQNDRLYALPQSQRQLMTLILRKLLASSTYAISGTLEALYKKLDTVIDNNENQDSDFEDNISDNYEEYDELKDEWDEDEEIKEEKKYTTQEIEEIKLERDKLKDFFELARSIQKNSKGEVLLTALKRGFDEAEKLGANRKAIIFTESTRTQKYLYNILQETQFKDKLVLFNGSNNDDKSKEVYRKWVLKNEGTDKISGSKTADIRSAITEYFRDEAEIMIATEAAAEGVNLQFCSLVVNYDLPWNPQRIEQRIGRCHRYGQKYDVVVVNFLNRSNAADERVFRLLSEKFQLFEGVFGASDEVLGAIESGLDFEKRIAGIYQNCRTVDEIQIAFDVLQKSLEVKIDETLQSTRQKLLENFDQEVHEKLRINLEESKIYLNKYEEWLWKVTKYCLRDHANFDLSENSFHLHSNPFPDEVIYPGPYKLGKNIEDSNIYRVGHPLAQRIISMSKSFNTVNKELEFDYSNEPIKVAVIEPLLNKSGWIKVTNYTTESFETEDHIILSGFTCDGEILDESQIKRLFLFPAIMKNKIEPDNNVSNRLNEIKKEISEKLLDSIVERDGNFFDMEIDKLEKWSGDRKNSLELELKELDIEIKSKKTEARKILNLEEKVNAQRHIKELEKKRNEMRMNLFEMQDEVDKRKDKLIEETEKRMNLNITEEELFCIKWTVK